MQEIWNLFKVFFKTWICLAWLHNRNLSAPEMNTKKTIIIIFIIRCSIIPSLRYLLSIYFEHMHPKIQED